MTHSRLLVAPGLALALVVATAGCRGQTSSEPQIVPIRHMTDQPRYDMQAESAYFEDGRTMRPQVAGTIAREMEIDPGISTGLNEDGSYVLTVPESIVRGARIPPQTIGGDAKTGMAALLDRGQQRYGIYCSPCHSSAGDGQGMIVRRGMQPPPSFHIDRLRHVPDGQLFATLSNGIRVMPAYRAQIPVADRWAIVAYVRALQISRAERAQNP